MKLKTLKDLIWRFTCEDSTDEMEIMYRKDFAEEIRKKAIQWIKELEFRMSYQEHKHDEKKALIHSVDWIKYFFNLKEKDLNET